MPDILLLVSPEAKHEVGALMPLLGPVLRKATAKALGDVTPEQVAVMAFGSFASDNATPMQILAVGSFSDNRQNRIRTWTVELAQAWNEFAKSHDISWGSKVDAWPTLPIGFWMMTDDESLEDISGKNLMVWEGDDGFDFCHISKTIEGDYIKLTGDILMETETIREKISFWIPRGIRNVKLIAKDSYGTSFILYSETQQNGWISNKMPPNNASGPI
jgi:hypothetical protein